jgi:glycosyltransferase involved in cell wall biosynthesis
MAIMPIARASRQAWSSLATSSPSRAISAAEREDQATRPTSDPLHRRLSGRSVLVLNHEFPPVGGGASPVAYQIAKAYVQRGHVVSVVTMAFKGLPAVERKDGMTIFRVRCVRRRSYICTVPEMLTFVIAARRFLSTHLRTYTYDASHAHFIVPGGAVALWAKRAFALPYIVTSHGSDVLGYNSRFRLVYPFVSRTWADVLAEARAVTSPTRFLADRIESLNPIVKVVRVGNAVDPEHFCALQKENRILVVARLLESKGIQDVLDAVARLDLTGWAVDVVGDGPYRSALERKVTAHHLDRFVTFHGWIDNDSDRIRQLYGRARIFVSASRCENMSVAVLEALAARCRVIASDVGGTPEIVSRASLFEPRSVEALRERLAAAMHPAVACQEPGFPDAFRWSGVIRQYEALCFP